MAGTVRGDVFASGKEKARTLAGARAYDHSIGPSGMKRNQTEESEWDCSLGLLAYQAETSNFPRHPVSAFQFSKRKAS